MPFYRIPDLQRWTIGVLECVGMSTPDASSIARLLVRSDARGIGTHGLARLESYIDRLNKGEFNPTPTIAITRHDSFGRLDADGAMGQVAGAWIVNYAVEHCKDSPMLWVSVANVGHLGALGVIALEAAEAGLMCLLGQRTPAVLSMEGFVGPGIGHNPFAFAAPTAQGEHFVFDMACSVAARGQILAAAREGKPIPAGWALDKQGQPTTNPTEAVHGSLLPVGGYKGMGIAMVMECLTAALSVQGTTPGTKEAALSDKGGVARESAFFLFLNPDKATHLDGYYQHMKNWMSHYQEAAGHVSRIPGSRGYALERVAQDEGIHLSDSVVAQLTHVGNDLAKPFCGCI